MASLKISGSFNRISPQLAFVLIAGFFGIACAVITPPTQTVDEDIHWCRVYQLSQGKFLAYKFGGYIPKSIGNLTAYFHNEMAYIPWGKTTPKEIFDRLNQPLNPRVTQFEPFPATAVYSVVPYAPQTIAMLIARKLKWPALWLLYAGRFGTVLGYVVIGSQAIRITPILKWPACMLLANPMAMMLSASLSADPVTIALAFLATALFLRCIVSGKQLSPAQVGSLAIAMVAVALCKSVYFPLAFLVLAIPRKCWSSGKSRWIASTIVILLPIAALLLWSALSNTAHVNDGIGPLHDRIHWVMYHPAKYLKIVRLSIAYFWTLLLQSSIGMLGYYETPFPSSIIAFFLISLFWITVAYDEPVALPAPPRLIAGSVYIFSYFLIITSVYIVWNPLHNYMIEALQGRYFLPISLLPLVVFRRQGRYPIQPRWMVVLLVCLSLLTLYQLVDRYYLPEGFLFKTMSGT